ncbi:MAG: hypothetical protein R2689_09105 [Microthrixaceae bacterium]|nr:hypothetical protein [Microthrixaceae bacterium]
MAPRRVSIRGSLRFSAESLGFALETFAGPVAAEASLRSLAVDPRDRLTSFVESVGHRVRFDGSLVEIEPAAEDGTPPWSERADRLFATLVHCADGGLLNVESAGESTVVSAGRAVAPLVAGDFEWIEPDPKLPPGSRSVAIPDWVRLSSAISERQFTLLSPSPLAPALPPSFAMVDLGVTPASANSGASSFVGRIGDGEILIAWRPLDDDRGHLTRALLERNVDHSVGGAQELLTAIAAARLYVGVILSDDPSGEDPRLGFMESVAVELGAVVMDGVGRLVRQR